MHTRVLGVLLVATLFQATQAADIIWVRQGRSGGNGVDNTAAGAGALAWEDDPWRELVESWGHSVTKFEAFDDFETIPFEDFDATMAEFNEADLVVMSRDSNSGDYNDPFEHEAWTSGFETPMIVMTPYLLRSSRWQMVDSTSITDASNPMLVTMPDHPIFEGIELSADNTVEFWSQLGEDDHIDLVDTTDFGFAQVIAVEAERELPWIAYWDGETEEGDFYDGSGTFAAGPRLYLSAGSDDDPNTWGEKNITEAGDQIFINAITFLTGDAGTPPVTALPNDCNSDGAVDAGDLSCIIASGGADGLNGLITELGILPGDLDGNGNVEFADFLALSANFGQDATSYSQGDIDANGKVEFADFLALSANFGQSASGAAAVPEPTSFLGLALGTLLVGAIRRRRGS